MGLFERKTPMEAELAKLEKQETRFLEKRKDKKDSFLNQKLEEKVPAGMQDKLDAAFAKAFQLVFEKGTGIIEKTYNKEKLEQEYEINQFATETKQNRKALKAFSKKAGKSGAVNLALSGASGIGLGLLGVGIPDIPLFTGMILKQVYETALNYGFEYESEQEKYFILKIIQGSVTYGESLVEIDDQLNLYMKEEQIPEDTDMKQVIEETAGCLSKELLYMKFLQGIPVAGAVGGAYDAIYMKRIAEYSEMKYRRRFYENRK